MTSLSALDELRQEACRSREWLESIVRDVTPEQANWQPPGNANTIARTYMHVVRNFDEDLNQRFFQRPLLSDGPWRGRTGLPSGLCEWEPETQIDWPALRQYGSAMHDFVVRTLDALTEADLDRRVEMGAAFGGTWDGIDVIRLTAGNHVWLHGGEIACLKGLKGLRGYTQGKDTERLYSQTFGQNERRSS